MNPDNIPIIQLRSDNFSKEEVNFNISIPVILVHADHFMQLVMKQRPQNGIYEQVVSVNTLVVRVAQHSTVDQLASELYRDMETDLKIRCSTSEPDDYLGKQVAHYNQLRFASQSPRYPEGFQGLAIQTNGKASILLGRRERRLGHQLIESTHSLRGSPS